MLTDLEKIVGGFFFCCEQLARKISTVVTVINIWPKENGPEFLRGETHLNPGSFMVVKITVSGSTAWNGLCCLWDNPMG